MPQPLLQTHDVCITAPSGRTLFRDLSLALDAGDQVALVGRNGVGKSTLLAVLAGHVAPTSGRVSCFGHVVFVPQQLDEPVAASPGQRRQRQLEQAFGARPSLLLLDEPTRDLDTGGVQWLCQQLLHFDGALLVVSHDRRLLRHFRDFFVASEAGSRHYHGAFDDVLEQLEAERAHDERYYLRQLGELEEKEQHNDRLRRRRERKKNLGRIRELKRCPARAQLNGKRGYAQESQGKRALLQQDRIDSARQWTRAARRALAVDLPLELAPPDLPPSETPIIVATALTTTRADRALFRDLELSIDRQRLAITGPNGSGKTTLVETLVGERAPGGGHVRSDAARLGFIAQNAHNWERQESLVDLLCPALSEAELEHCAQRLHLLGLAALERTLAAWPGGLLIVSHDDDTLHRLGIDQRLCLA